MLANEKGCDFSLGENVTLSSLAHGKNGVILSFLPHCKNLSSAIQLKSYRNNFSKINENNWSLVVICGGDPLKVKKFQEENALPFAILSDLNSKIADSYDAVGDIQLINGPKPVLRRTFLLNSEMNITNYYDQIEPEFHIDEILEQIGKDNSQMNWINHRFSSSQETQ